MSSFDSREGEALQYASETYAIRSCIFEVMREMGPGFLEAVYQECLGLEFAARKIPSVARKKLTLSYKGVALQQTYSPDFICHDAIVIELKVARALLPEHRAQLLNYLKATKLPVGLLVNFGEGSKATIERLVR